MSPGTFISPHVCLSLSTSLSPSLILTHIVALTFCLSNLFLCVYTHVCFSDWCFSDGTGQMPAIPHSSISIAKAGRRLLLIAYGLYSLAIQREARTHTDTHVCTLRGSCTRKSLENVKADADLSVWGVWICWVFFGLGLWFIHLILKAKWMKQVKYFINVISKIFTCYSKYRLLF